MDNLDITPELALSAARVLKAWCIKGGGHCRPNGGRCIFRGTDNVCFFSDVEVPDEWELPERSNDG